MAPGVMHWKPWIQAYDPLGAAWLSTLAAAFPIVLLLVTLGILEWRAHMAALGYRNFSADELVTMRIHGVSPEYVASLQRAGMTHLSADELVRLRLAGFDASRR